MDGIALLEPVYSWHSRVPLVKSYESKGFALKSYQRVAAKLLLCQSSETNRRA